MDWVQTLTREQVASAVLAALWLIASGCSSDRLGAEAVGGAATSHAGTSAGTPSIAGSPAVAGTSSIAGAGNMGQAGALASAGANSSGGTSGASTNVGGTTSSSAGASAGMSGSSASGASSTGGSGHAGASGSNSGPTFHVFLLLGQSNMAGYPKAQAADKVKNERIRVLGFDDCAATGRQKDKWDVAVAPLHECWNGALGPGDYFAKTLIDELPAGDTIGLVPCAISGEKIETFLKVGGSKYGYIVDRAKAAQQAGGVIEGMLFHQGESNCGDSAWPGKVNTLVTDLRKDLNLGNVPFLAGELAPTGACSQHNTQVAKLPSLVTNAVVVSAAGLVLDPADTQYHLHFDHDSQVTFGKRYEAAMVQALHW